MRSKNVPSNLWGTFNVYLDYNDEIGPGQEKIFTFEITAPSEQGATPFTWQMQKQWSDQNSFFGDELDIMVTVGAASCVGDLNGDGYRDEDDLALFAEAFGSVSGDANYEPLADLENGPDDVDGSDLAAFAGVFGTDCP